MYITFVKILVQFLDALGTLAFALSGALVGVQKQFDLFGVLFLSFVVAVVGGMMRDVLIGAVPPAAVTDVHYSIIAILGGLITFYWYPRIASLQRQILLLDAVGLALFAALSAQKALAYGVNPVMAAIMGMLTGIGGGMVRDVLAGEIPFVLRGDIYALAALAAGTVVAIGHEFNITPLPTMLGGAALCILLRLLAIYRGWHAPLPHRGHNRKGQ